MRRSLLIAISILGLLSLSGCFGSGSNTFDFVPGHAKRTGDTVHLKATVVDYDSELFPGLNTWLWAFCFAPVNANDAYSANAIEGWTPLAGDKAVDAAGNLLNTDAVGVCSVPGPTLRVKQGDRVIVEFAHSHFHPHTIHWHGQLVNWESDGAPGVSQDSVTSGGAFKYDFIAEKAGTLWYHCHVDTQLHVQQGLYGVIIVEPASKKYEPKGIDREYVLVFSTMNRNTVEAVGKSRHSHPAGCASGFPDFNGEPCENPTSLAGKPDIFLLNGHSYPFTMDQMSGEDGKTHGSLIVMKEGERIRLRLLNAGETIEEIHPHGHDMQVVAKDGNPLSPSARYWADVLTIGPAERYDVIITADNPGPWMLHTHVNSHETNCMKAPGGMHTMMVYEDYLDKMHQFKAEAPVDCPAGESLVLPGDFHNTTSFAANTVGLTGVPQSQQPAQEFAWSFPVDLPCAVRSLEVYANAWQSAASRQANLANVVVTLRPPGGETETATAVPGDSDSWAFVAKEHTLNGNVTTAPGDYQLTIKVSGADVKLDMDVHVDYYESFEQSKIGHLLYKVGGCPGYT